MRSKRISLTEQRLNEIHRSVEYNILKYRLKAYQQGANSASEQSKNLVDLSGDILRSLNISLGDALGLDWTIEAKNLMLKGEKIKAIKYCRNATGMTLHDAKRAVESLV